MKLKLTKLAFTGVNGQDGTDAISLERNGSDFVAPITLQLRPGSEKLPAVASQSRIKLTSACESTKNGTRRALMRTAVPYIGLFPANSQDGASVSAVSAARSGKEISFHTVMTVPRECFDDIVNQKAGSEGYKLAVTQIISALKLHLALIGDGTGRIQKVKGSRGTKLDEVKKVYFAGVKFNSATNALSEENVYSQLDSDGMNAYGLPQAVADQPWLRALTGLKPLADDAEVGMSVILED